jgi:hypothetical protein
MQLPSGEAAQHDRSHACQPFSPLNSCPKNCTAPRHKHARVKTAPLTCVIKTICREQDRCLTQPDRGPDSVLFAGNTLVPCRTRALPCPALPYPGRVLACNAACATGPHSLWIIPNGYWCVHGQQLTGGDHHCTLCPIYFKRYLTGAAVETVTGMTRP